MNNLFESISLSPAFMKITEQVGVLHYVITTVGSSLSAEQSPVSLPTVFHEWKEAPSNILLYLDTVVIRPVSEDNGKKGSISLTEMRLQILQWCEKCCHYAQPLPTAVNI